MIYALLSLLNTILSYFDINVEILSYIGSVSLVTLVLLYITSDVYLAINSQYHNYICLFKQWFDVNDIDCKIIQSAIHYWFNDDDWAYKDKVQKLFK